MKNNYLRYAVIALLFLIPFVGFVVSTNLFFPYITGKTLFFRFLIEIAFACYVMLALQVPAYRPKLTPLFLAFSAFIAVILAADIFGVYPFKSFWSNFERMEGFITHIHLFAYFIMLSAVFTGEKMWTYFFQTSLATSVIMGLISFDPEKSQAGRVFANLGNSTYLGVYMLFHIFIAGFLLVRVIERKGEASAKWMAGALYGLVILFDFFIFYNTGTRGALLGLVAGAFLTSIAFAIWEKNRGLKILGISGIALIVITVGLLAGFKNSQFIQDRPLLTRFAALATFDRAELEKFATTQGKSRFGIWSVAYEGFKERPILGWGQDNFNYVFNKYYDPKIYDQEQWFDRAHNVFFDWLVAGGILGLLSYLALFVAAIIAIWRSKAHEKDLYFLFSDKILLTALLVAYFIHNLFVFDSITSYILFFGVLAFINIHDRKAVAWPALSTPIRNESYLFAGKIVVMIVAGVALYYFTIAPYIAGRTLIQAISYHQFAMSNNSVPAFERSVDSYQKALSYNSVVGISETREQLLQSAANSLISPNTPPEIRTVYFTMLQDEMKKLFETVPADARYHLFYGSVLTRIGRVASSTQIMDEGITHLNKAVELSPRKQSILFEAGAAYINNNRYAEAIPYFKKAFEGETSHENARFLYGLALIYAGDNKDAEELLKPLDGTAYLGDYRLLKAYYDTKQNLKLQQALIYKLAYADKLAAAGDKAGAIREIREAMQISPSLKAEGEKRLKLLE